MRCRYCHTELTSPSIIDGDFCCDDHRQMFELEGSAPAEVSKSISAAVNMLRQKFPPRPPERAEEPVVAPSIARESITRERIQPEVEQPEVEQTEVEQTAQAAAMPEAVMPATVEPETSFAETALPEVTLEQPVFAESAFAESTLAESTLAESTSAESTEEFEAAFSKPAAFGTFESEAEPSAVESETLETSGADETSGAFELDAEPPEPRPRRVRESDASWTWLTSAWKKAPRDLKLVGMLLPVLLAIAISASLPKVQIQKLTTQNMPQVQQVQKVVALQWKNVNQTISDRAAVAFADDFRSGLDAWESRSNLTRSWSYDVAGFVRPGPLAIFKPTIELTDYRFEFLAEIDQKAMGWAFRAQDFNNYYAMKFVVVKPGPLPLIHIVRYAVINGKEGPHVDKPLPLTVRPDMLYRIQVNTRGGDFTIMAQGQVVDFWTDNRLKHGGVGFFCNRGERARLRWVEVSHQYDALGRLCAYLAPYGMDSRNGSVN